VPPNRRATFEAAIGERQCVRFEIDCQGTALLSSSAPLRSMT
jgi:hypothetical protein